MWRASKTTVESYLCESWVASDVFFRCVKLLLVKVILTCAGPQGDDSRARERFDPITSRCHPLSHMLLILCKKHKTHRTRRNLNASFCALFLHLHLCIFLSLFSRFACSFFSSFRLDPVIHFLLASVFFTAPCWLLAFFFGGTSLSLSRATKL